MPWRLQAGRPAAAAAPYPLACLQQGKSTAAVQLEEDEDYAPETITITRTRPEQIPKPDRQPKPYRSVADDAAVRAATQACFPTRNDWTRAEVQAVYDQPLLELIRDAGACHRAHWDSRDVQQCTLLSIKTGGCTEDCGYCSQSGETQDPRQAHEAVAGRRSRGIGEKGKSRREHSILHGRRVARTRQQEEGISGDSGDGV